MAVLALNACAVGSRARSRRRFSSCCSRASRAAVILSSRLRFSDDDSACATNAIVLVEEMLADDGLFEIFGHFLQRWLPSLVWLACSHCELEAKKSDDSDAVSDTSHVDAGAGADAAANQERFGTRGASAGGGERETEHSFGSTSTLPIFGLMCNAGCQWRRPCSPASPASPQRLARAVQPLFWKLFGAAPFALGARRFLFWERCWAGGGHECAPRPATCTFWIG